MDDTLDKAFRVIPRREFLPPEVADQAQLDTALPIGSNVYTIYKDEKGKITQQLHPEYSFLFVPLVPGTD